MRCADACINAVRKNPALNRSSALQQFEHGNVLEIHNKVMFNLYPGLYEETGHAYFSSVAILNSRFHNYNHFFLKA